MSKQKGRGGMGTRKHGASGHAGKSPKQRMADRLQAEREGQEQKPKKREWRESLKELFDKKPKR